MSKKEHSAKSPNITGESQEQEELREHLIERYCPTEYVEKFGDHPRYWSNSERISGETDIRTDQRLKREMNMSYL